MTRKVDGLSLVAFEGGQYSVPHELAGQAVWVRRHGGQVVITHAGPAGPAEVARHLVTAPGSPRVRRQPLPARAARCAEPHAEAAHRRPRPRFLAIGDGAGLWLAEAAAAGATRVRAKMAQAVQLAALHGAAAVDRALGQAAAAGRFADGDLAAILAHQASAADRRAVPAPTEQPLAGPGHRRVGPARREGGRPMTLRRPDQDAVLTSRGNRIDPPGSWSACSDVLAWAGQHAGPAWHEAAAEITAAAGRGRTAGGLITTSTSRSTTSTSPAPAGSSR